VILDCSDQVRAKVKVPTTADVTSGIIAALDAVVRSTGMDASRITHAMLGTTHAINAMLERRKPRRPGPSAVSAVR
jgi:N-methylhydantoinase A/oxoprolinase/acetone carboxylase beta subunit